jgi:hypothetical protein
MKRKLTEYIAKLSFPDKERFSSSDDGLTYAFVYKTNKKLKRLSTRQLWLKRILGI